MSGSVSNTKDPIIGLSILKDFTDIGYFSGTVLDVSTPTGYEPQYTLKYTDGDEEQLSRSEVMKLLMPNSPCVFASVKLSGSSQRIVPRYFLNNIPHLVLWGKLEALGWRLVEFQKRGEKIDKRKKKSWQIFRPSDNNPSEVFPSIEKALDYAFSSCDAKQFESLLREIKPIVLDKDESKLGKQHTTKNSATKKSKSKNVTSLRSKKTSIQNQQEHLPVENHHPKEKATYQITCYAVEDDVLDDVVKATLTALPPIPLNTLYEFLPFNDSARFCMVSKMVQKWCHRKWREEKVFPFTSSLNMENVESFIMVTRQFPSVGSISVKLQKESKCIKEETNSSSLFLSDRSQSSCSETSSRTLDSIPMYFKRSDSQSDGRLSFTPEVSKQNLVSSGMAICKEPLKVSGGLGSGSDSSEIQVDRPQNPLLYSKSYSLSSTSQESMSFLSSGENLSDVEEKSENHDMDAIHTCGSDVEHVLGGKASQEAGGGEKESFLELPMKCKVMKAVASLCHLQELELDAALLDGQLVKLLCREQGETVPAEEEGGGGEKYVNDLISVTTNQNGSRKRSKTSDSHPIRGDLQVPTPPLSPSFSNKQQPLPLHGLLTLQLNNCDMKSMAIDRTILLLCDAIFLPLLKRFGMCFKQPTQSMKNKMSSFSFPTDDAKSTSTSSLSTFKCSTSDKEEEDWQYYFTCSNDLVQLFQLTRGLQSLELDGILLTQTVTQAIESLKWSLISLNLIHCVYHHTTVYDLLGGGDSGDSNIVSNSSGGGSSDKNKNMKQTFDFSSGINLRSLFGVGLSLLSHLDLSFCSQSFTLQQLVNVLKPSSSSLKQTLKSLCLQGMIFSNHFESDKLDLQKNHKMENDGLRCYVSDECVTNKNNDHENVRKKFQDISHSTMKNTAIDSLDSLSNNIDLLMQLCGFLGDHLKTFDLSYSNINDKDALYLISHMSSLCSLQLNGCHDLTDTFLIKFIDLFSFEASPEQDNQKLVLDNGEKRTSISSSSCSSSTSTSSSSSFSQVSLICLEELHLFNCTSLSNSQLNIFAQSMLKKKKEFKAMF